MNDQDRALTELAAKAIGLPECGWMGGTYCYVKDNTFEEFDPLTDGDDTLMVATELGMHIGVEDACVSTWVPTAGALRCWKTESYKGATKSAATRRAVVRTAAEFALKFPRVLKNDATAG